MFVLAVVMISALSACTAGGVGDPCMPAAPSIASQGDPQCAPDAGCFSGSEFYIETRSVQCRTRICVVDHWDQIASPERRSELSYCTCRCDEGADPSVRCPCPEGFHCGIDVAAGEPGIRGRYCERNAR